MKVLQLNQSDMIGGAAIAGYRLHQELLRQNIDSRIIVGTKTIDNERIIAAPRKIKIENQLSRINSVLGLNYLNVISSFNLTANPAYQEADILHFHNLHGGYFNYLAIPKLTKNKPTVFTLHDMWSFTGHCSYSYDCQKWQTGCGKCPYPNTPPKIKRDNTAIEWKLKNWVYSNSNLTIVTPSQWLSEQAKKSILNRFPIHCIPNGVDVKAYQPLDQKLCRSVLGIAQEKKVLMFVAQNLQDTRKGGHLLLKSLSQMPQSLKNETVLLTLGNGGEDIEHQVGIKTLNLGYVSNDRLKAIAYSAVDLFIFPTMADNLPIVLQESMACGTPMVSFKIGGVPDLVRPNITGYLAESENTEDFRQGITQLLEDKDLRNCLSLNCRQIAIEEYSLETQAKKYIELYLNKINIKNEIK